LTGLRRRCLGAYTAGIRDNHIRCGPLANDAAAVARRFRDHQDMIVRFVADLAVPFTNYAEFGRTTKNQAERDLRPVKIQQRTSGGTWRTLAGPADFALVQSYLSTARNWGLDSYDALTRLFTTGAWLPPAAPAENSYPAGRRAPAHRAFRRHRSRLSHVGWHTAAAAARPLSVTGCDGLRDLGRSRASPRGRGGAAAAPIGPTANAFRCACS
jgi:hypothetical protein